MLRAAHYKPDAVEVPHSGKSPPKHRTGGFLDLALTAADKYALSLLPTALKGTALGSSEPQGQHEYRTPQPQPTYGAPTPFKMQRGVGNPLQQNIPSQSHGGGLQYAVGDNRMASSWDASLKEILSALEPDSRTLKPARLRDHKYPNQNHGLPTNATLPPPRRELDDVTMTLPGGTRRNKAAVPSYTAALKGFSRQTRRPEVPNVDVQYDVVPSVRLAWAGPSAGTYSTTGFGGSPKKYTSQLVGRVSPHYSGMQLQPVPPGSQDTLHLPDIAAGSSFRGTGFASPNYQSWSQTASPGVLSALAGHSTHPRKALPYVSSQAPSLAKPLQVQYHPVLKSSSMRSGAAASAPAQPMVSTLQPSKSTPQRPFTDQGGHPYLPLPAEASGAVSRPPPHGSPSYRLPHTPPEIAAEVARLRHAQELDGVISGVRSDLQRSGSPRSDVPMKSKFLQMYEDPNRPLTRLNPKQLLADMLPAQNQQPAHRRQRPPILATDKRQSAGGGGAPPSLSPSGSGAQGRSPMYERRLKPLPSSPGEGNSQQQDEADSGGLQNVHLTPPGAPTAEDSQVADSVLSPTQEELEPRATTSGRSTPRSMGLEQDDALLTQHNFGAEAVESGDQTGDASQPQDEAAVPAGTDGDLQVQEQLSASRGPTETGAAEGVVLEAVQDRGASSTGEAPGEADALPVSADAVDAAQAAAAMQPEDVPPTGQPDGAAPEVPSSTAEAPAPVQVADEEVGADVPAETTTEGPESLAESPEAAAAVGQEGAASGEAGPEPAEGYAAVGLETAAAAEEGRQQEPDAAIEAVSDQGVARVPSDGAEAAVEEAPGAASEEAPAPDGAESAAPSAEEGEALPAVPKTSSDAPLEQPAEADAAAADGTAELEPSSLRPQQASDAAEAPAGDASDATPVSGEVQAAATAPAPDAVMEFILPPGVTPEMMEASVICIQAHARGLRDRRRAAVLRGRRDAGEAPQPAESEAAGELSASAAPAPDAPSTSFGRLGYLLPPGVTEEMATEALLRIQSHARGYFARRRVADLKMSRTAGEAALTEAVTAAAKRKALDYALPPDYQLPPGVTPEMAESAVMCMQAHARGHLARRRVRDLRAARDAGQAAAAADAAVEEPQAGSRDDADTAMREAGEAVSTNAGGEEPAHSAELSTPADDGLEAAEAATAPPPVPQEEVVQELTIDALKAALADDEDEDDTAAAKEEAGEQAGGAAPEEAPAPDPSDPATIAAAAAAAKSARQLLSEEPVADTAATVDQAAAEASMARLAANSARTSAMFQGAGAEMRYSDDEASAMELMDNLDGLLQGDDEAAAAAAAVAAAAAPAEGELVSISADGVSEPQALGSVGSAGAVSPMDVSEPGGVRVLAGKYEVQHVVGEGAYGMVMKCKVRGTEPVQWVAIKEFKIDDSDPDAEDVKRTSLREVAVLEALQHPHVVGFVDKFMVGDRLFIVMEFLPCNLLELLEAQPGGMDRDAVRLIMFQLCSAIAFIHSKGMIYRDIKPENLLVDEHGTVKLCDFGFARYLPSGPSSHLTDYVATRWYRAPELLLGPPYRDSTGKHIQYMYGPQVDMWAVGCLMGELLDGEPLFAGDSDLDQLYRVQQILGPMAPTHQYLFYANPHNTGIVFNIKQPVTLGTRYRGKVSDVELSFMSGLLEMDPDKRLTGEQCLQHPYLMDLAAAANALPTPSVSMTPTDVSGGGAMPSDPGAAPDSDILSQAPDTLPPAGSASGEETTGTASDGLAPAAQVSPSPVARGPSYQGEAAMYSREAEKAGSLTRAAGSLTRGGRSMSRGGVSPAMGAAPSPAPGAGSMRTRANLRTSDSGRVVIVEGVEEGDEAGAAPAPAQPAVTPSASIPRGMTAGLSEIEPA